MAFLNGCTTGGMKSSGRACLLEQYLSVKPHVFRRDHRSRELRKRRRSGARLAKYSANCLRKCFFRRRCKWDIVAAFIPTKLTESGNIRADDTATGEQCLCNGQTEALNKGRCEKKFAVSIAPEHFRFTNATQEHDTFRQARCTDEAMDLRRLWPVNSDNHEQRGRMDLFLAKQAPETLQSQQQVFIPAMLCDAKEKRASLPLRQRVLSAQRSTGFHAVINPDSLFKQRPCSLIAKLSQRAVGNAGNSIGSP